MSRSKLLPEAPVRAVRADTSILECIRILREGSIGALVIVSDDSRENLVGIFTERDLIKSIELIQQSDFWSTPIRTVMTPRVHTVEVNDIDQAPKIMAKYNIRHLPVVLQQGSRTRLVGVVSMRDVFRVAMQSVDFDIGRLLYSPKPVAKTKQRSMVLYSTDKGITSMLTQVAKSASLLTVNLSSVDSLINELADYGEKFDAILVDIDGLSSITIKKLLSAAKEIGKNSTFYLVFSASQLTDSNRTALAGAYKRNEVVLLSKPISAGQLYERLKK